MENVTILVVGIIFWFLFFGPHAKSKEKKDDKKDDKKGGGVGKK